MDTSKHLMNLLNRKANFEEPGREPILSGKDLESIQNMVIIDNAEMIAYLSACFNEPAVLEYVMSRYRFDPNKLIQTAQVSVTATAHQKDLTTYDSVLLFGCYEVLDLFLNNHIYPKNWLLYFRAAAVYQNDTMLKIALDTPDIRAHIKLTTDEIATLKDLYRYNEKMRQFLTSLAPINN